MTWGARRAKRGRTQSSRVERRHALELSTGMGGRLHGGGIEIREGIQWTRHARRTLSRHVRVDHCRLQTFMAEQNLNREYVDAALDEMRCETMALMPISA